LICVILIVSVFFYLDTYSIKKEDIDSEIIKVLEDKNVNIQNYRVVKALEKYGCRVVLFETDENPQNIGLAILEKGINGRYKKLKTVSVVDNHYAFGHRYLRTDYLCVAGLNTGNKIAYVGVSTNDGKLIKDKLDSDYFIRFYDMSSADHINFFDAYGNRMDLPMNGAG